MRVPKRVKGKWSSRKSIPWLQVALPGGLAPISDCTCWISAVVWSQEALMVEQLILMRVISFTSRRSRDTRSRKASPIA